MGYAPFAIEITCVFLLTLILFQRYSNIFRQHLMISIATICAWYASFVIISVLPLDISLTYHNQCIKQHEQSRRFDLPSSSAPPPPALPLRRGRDVDGVDPTSSSPPLSSPSTINDTAITATSTFMSSSTIITTMMTTMSSSSSPPGDVMVCEEPWNYLPPSALPTLWIIVYWTSQFLTWLFLPLLKSYTSAGNFTMLGKVKTALIENAIWYGSYLLIFGILLIYVAARPDLELDGGKLKVICITASNTWGLFLLVWLLGYGLVEVPLTLWNSSKRGHTLARTHFRISKLSVERAESVENLEDVLEDIKRINRQIKASHPLRQHFETIVDKCPDNVRLALRGASEDVEEDHRMETPTQKSLVHLHQRLILYTQKHNRVEVQWQALLEKALHLEDVSTNELNPLRRFKHAFTPQHRPQWISIMYSPAVEWYWECVVRPYILKGLAIILACLSFMIVWSEATFFNKQPVLSFFALMLDAAKEGYNYVYIEAISLLSITYLSICAYYTIFHVKILNYYYLDSHQHTDSTSLLFSGMLLCRLTPPLCLNFLGLIHLDSKVTSSTNQEETAYTKIMGHMDVIGIISRGFNIYFPIAIILLCFATYFNLGSRCLHMMGFEQFLSDDDDITEQMVSEGREIMRREKRSRLRVVESSARRQEWAARFEESSRSRREAMEAAREGDIFPPGSSPNSRTHLKPDGAPDDTSSQPRYNSSSTRSADLYHSYNRGAPTNIFDDV